MSIQPIKDYFDCLSLFAGKSFERIDRNSGMDMAKISALIQQGCLSGIDASTTDGHTFFDVAITPNGAVVLAEWQTFLRLNSLQGKIMETLGKIVWLIAGMVITVGGALLLKIIE